MILIIFGAGVDCQVNLSANPGVAASQSGVCAVFLRFPLAWVAGADLVSSDRVTFPSVSHGLLAQRSGSGFPAVFQEDTSILL